MSDSPPAARVLVLCGPSGAGKSRLARRLHERHGWPVLPLDDFYRDDGDPALPMSPWGVADWDDPRSWHADAALRAVERLCREGSVQAPVYDIAASAVTGTRVIQTHGSPVVVAEGIFAGQAIVRLQERGLLADAWCLRHRPWVTFGRRLVRDLAEHRKPPLTLWRRGHALRRAEPGIVRAQQALGATPVTVAEAERWAADLADSESLTRPGAQRPEPRRG